METKIATNENQSKKLIELGIDVNTADMYYSVIDDSFKLYDDNAKLYVNDGLNLDVDWKNVFSYDKILPAWSLSALLNLIPNENNNERNYCYIEVYVGYYTVNYCNNWDGRIFSTKSNKCLLDAAFEMVCYLLENKLI